MLKGAVIGGFSILWKTAGRKLPAFQVIADAVATYAFAGARVITAIAMGEILFFFAFHIKSPYLFLLVCHDKHLIALHIVKK